MAQVIKGAKLKLQFLNPKCFTFVLTFFMLFSSSFSLGLAAETTATAASSQSILKIESPDSVEEGDSRKFSGRLQLFVTGRQIEDEFSKGQVFGTTLLPRFEGVYQTWLKFNLEFVVNAATGNVTGFYSEDGKPSSFFLIKELSMEVEPSEKILLRAGALPTSLSPILSVMSDNAFIGVSEEWHSSKEKEETKIGLRLAQAIPSSGNVTKGLVDESVDPYFVSGTFFIDVAAETLSSTFRLSSTRYEFGNLSSNVASDSVMVGNSPSSFESIGKNSRFVIGFSGVESAASAETEWGSRWSTQLKASVIENPRAQNSNDRGQQASLGLTYKGEDLSVTPSVGVFKVGADVIPAAYTTISSRYNNREGQWTSLKLNFEKQKLSVSAKYTQANELTDNPYLADRSIYSFTMESNHDLF